MRLSLSSGTNFPHRSNEDGSIDSICPRCFATVGSSMWEADLEELEKNHICNPEQRRHFDDARQKNPFQIREIPPRSTSPSHLAHIGNLKSAAQSDA